MVYEDDDLALYYDSEVDRSITWPNTTFSDVWEYVKTVYGSYGEDKKLYAILHTNKYSGGHPSTFMDESHDFRNVVDCGPYTWQEEDPDLGLSMMIHEVGHIVEGATNGIQYNPAWDIWGDSKWAEIFVTLPGLGKIAKLSRSKVLPLFASMNTEDGTFDIEILPAFELDRGEEQDARTCNEAIEYFVGDKPEQYMWVLQLLHSQEDGNNYYNLFKPRYNSDWKVQ